jgi:hypothetical protein
MTVPCEAGMTVEGGNRHATVMATVIAQGEENSDVTTSNDGMTVVTVISPLKGGRAPRVEAVERWLEARLGDGGIATRPEILHAAGASGFCEADVMAACARLGVREIPDDYDPGIVLWQLTPATPEDPS